MYNIKGKVLIILYLFLYKGGDNLAFEVVKQISSIEKEGEELVKNAGLKAVEVQKASKQEAEEIIEKAKADAQEYYKMTMERYEQEAGIEVKPILEQAEISKNKLQNISPDIMDRAVNLVIERIVNSNGNS